MDRIKEFFHTKTPKEMMQENKRAIRQARRELEREKNRLNKEKTRNENEIRKLAAKGEQKALRTYAKNIVNQRNQINKLGAMDATLSTLESEASSMNAQMTMANVMFKTTKTLARLNRMMPLQDFQKTMQMFEQNMTANNIKQEMMSDAMDAAFEGDEDEEATDELVDQVLNELNITMANQIPIAQNGALAGRAANPAQGQQAQAISTADADLEARLEALRRN
jgi:charged multivesicular body protein 2A